MTFASVVIQLLNGLAAASSLFLVSAGLSLIFGVTRIVNFAHGSLYMLGLYGAYTLIEALGHGSGANWSLSRWGKSTGKWAEKDMDVALDLAQDAKVPMPIAGLVDQAMKAINQDKMKALLS